MEKFKKRTEFLEELFRWFEKEKVRYCILRNYDPIKGLTGRDVDIVIEKRCSKEIGKIIKFLSIKFSLEVYHNDKIWFEQFFLFKESKKGYEFLQLDFFREISWWGNLIIPSIKILERREKLGKFFVPEPADEAFITWVYPFISGGKLKGKYIEKITTWANSGKFKFLLNALFGENLANKILHYLIRGDFGELSKFRNRARIKIIYTNIKNRFLDLIKVFSLTLFFAIKNYLKPKGIWVGVIGPDGSGKTSVSENLMRIFDHTIFEVQIFHWRPSILPSLSKLLKGKDSGAVVETIQNPYRAKPSGFISSLFRLFYYTIDFVIGYFLKVRKRLYKGHLVIFDRYFHDFMVDPYRSRISLPFFIPYILAKLVPHPDFIFYLHAGPDTIRKRKQELSPDKIVSLNQKYKRACSKLKYCIEIDGERDLKEIAIELEKYIMEKWKKNFKKL